MSTILSTIRFALCAAAAATLASCTEGSPGRLTAPEGASLAASGATLLQCPSSTTTSRSAVIGLLGGVIALDGHVVAIPANAVLVPTQFTLTVPASSYVEVDIRAAGQEHFVFERPVSLTLSYARCNRADVDRQNLRIFYIDSRTRAIIDDMGGTDNKVLRTVTTGTGHFSGYVIGQGRAQQNDSTANP
jgi:hypothetical protein